MTSEQIKTAEEICSEQSRTNRTVYSKIVPLAQAKAIQGLRAVFDEVWLYCFIIYFIYYTVNAAHKIHTTTTTKTKNRNRYCFIVIFSYRVWLTFLLWHVAMVLCLTFRFLIKITSCNAGNNMCWSASLAHDSNLCLLWHYDLFAYIDVHCYLGVPRPGTCCLYWNTCWPAADGSWWFCWIFYICGVLWWNVIIFVDLLHYHTQCSPQC